MKKYHSIVSKKGIASITVLAIVISIPLAQHLYQLEYASRSLNPLYEGSYGSEISVPFIIGLITYLFLKTLNNIQQRRNKYDL